VTSKISALVHAGKYAEAEKLTAASLMVYPDDQRLVKAQALITRLLAPGSSTEIPASSLPAPPSPPSTPTAPTAPASNATAALPVDSSPIPAASSPGASAIAPRTATLHLYRLSHIAGAFSKYEIEVDGRRIVKIGNAQSVKVELTPGKHNVNATYHKAKSDHPLYDLEIEPGREYWIRIDLTSGLIPHMRLAVVAEGEAREESGKLKEIVSGDRPGK
jgi:hypothetical protein